MKTNKQARLLGVLIGVLFMAVALIAPVVNADSFGPGAPDLTGVAQSQTYTFINARVLTSSTTITYSTSPLRLAYWAVADVFVTGDVSGTTAFTVTPQYSADNVNWVNATYTYIATGTLTTVTPQIVINSDTTSFMRIPMAGEYLRFRVDNSGSVTVTVKATMKNGTR